jgi:NADH:ubiquinone oxidoreductase subunit E
MKSILICTNLRDNPNLPSCAARGSEAIKQRIQDEVAKHNIAINVKEIKCLGECDVGPNLRLIPGGAFCRGVQLDDVAEIIQKAKNFIA